MAGVSFIDYKGKRVLYEDYSGCTPDTLEPYLAKAKDLIAQQRPKSVLAIVNVTGAKFDTKVAEMMKVFVKANEPFIKCTTIFGLAGLQSVIYRGLVTFSGRDNLKVCNTEDEAKEYLAALP